MTKFCLVLLSSCQARHNFLLGGTTDKLEDRQMEVLMQTKSEAFICASLVSSISE